MMWRNRIYVLVLAAAVMAVVSPRNLTAQDSTMINALDYSMQKRYRPENEPFVNDKFADNTYVGIHAGIFGLSPREGNVYSSGEQNGVVHVEVAHNLVKVINLWVFVYLEDFTIVDSTLLYQVLLQSF